MSVAPLTFSGISAAQYAILVQKAAASGIQLTGNSGTASSFGVEVSWNYSPDAKQLTFQCLKTPFFIKAEDVNAKIQSLVTETLA